MMNISDVRHKYHINFQYTGIGFDGKSHYNYWTSGAFDVYSSQEMPFERLQRIVEEVKTGIPDGINYDAFEEHVYRELEKRGLHRFEKIVDRGPIGGLVYREGELPVSELS